MQFAAALYSKAIRAGSSPSAPAPGADFKACQFSPVHQLVRALGGAAQRVPTKRVCGARRVYVCVCVRARACVRACVRARARACVRVCVCVCVCGCRCAICLWR